MAYQPPTIEPTTLHCGDRWQWTKDLGDYPASDGWTLTYYLHSTDLNGAARHITITATASGEDHAIDVPAATTANYVQGTYYWRSFVFSGTSRYQVEAGSIKVEPNFATLTQSYDGRSDARIILDAHITAYKNRASRPEQSYSLSAAGQSFSYKSDDMMIAAIQFWKSEVAREEAAANAARGINTGKDIFVRFSST